MIEIQGLIKQYGLQTVLRGVNLEVAEGEFITLVGPNGAGKSTLLRIVATLLKPTAGRVQIGGWALPAYAHKVRGHIGLVSHQALLYGDLTAAENLAFYARLYQLDEAQARVETALHMVGLAARQYDFVRTFSRGMIQRLAIARATLHDPDVLLLDEPYTGLDQSAVGMLDDLLREQVDSGRTIFMITHDLIHGLSICDRIAILSRGKIARELVSRHTSQAEFLEVYAEVTGQHTRANTPEVKSPS